MSVINTRALKEAQKQALLQSTQIKTSYSRNKLTSWTDIHKQFRFDVPAIYSKLPFTYANLSLFTRYWEQSYEARIKASLEETEVAKIKIDKAVSTFGTTTLFPEQQGCYKAILNHYNQGGTAALQDGYTGSGKTYIGAAIIAEIKSVFNTPENMWRLHPVIICSPKGVCESWRRVLEAFGLGDLLRRRKIYVMSDSEFSTKAGEIFVKEHEDDITGEISIKWNPIMVPVLTIVDECHRYVNPKTYRSKCINALIEHKAKILFMSATPMEKINDSFLFTKAINEVIPLINQKITNDNFKFFASLLDNEPHKPNREAMKRLRKVLNPWIFSIPYVKPKYKAVNVVQLVDFRNENDHAIYHSAHERYLAACTKAGKNTAFGRFEAFIALQNYRKTVEPLRAWWIAARAAENYKAGNLATAVGTAYKETITNIAFELVDVYKIPREQISIVWGGKREYKPSDLLSKEELDNLIKGGIDPFALAKDKALKKRIVTTLRYLQDKEEHSETVEQQASRHNRLKELKLTGKQTDNVRQIEIDKFQSGESKIVLFTIASGGVGLSFDRYKESLLPREGIFTPVFSGKEFQQLLGRLVRRASIADAIQRICMMRNTVEEFHVAPILDEKLKCIAEITNRNFDIIDLLQQSSPADHIKVRDINQAAVDAEQDNTIVSDFVSEIDNEEEEELEEVL